MDEAIFPPRRFGCAVLRQHADCLRVHLLHRKRRRCSGARLASRAGLATPVAARYARHTQPRALAVRQQSKLAQRWCCPD